MPSERETSAAPGARPSGLTRRRLLAWCGGALAALAAAALARRTTLARWMFAATPGTEPRGRLGDAATDTLDSVVATLLEDRVERSHYLDMFRWRAENLPGMRALYERFAMRLDHDAQRAGHASFRSAPAEARRRLLDPFRRSHGRERLRRTLAARDDERFARHVVVLVFRMFARTDAWVLSGYDAWPGMPRAVASLRKGGVKP